MKLIFILICWFILTSATILNAGYYKLIANCPGVRDKDFLNINIAIYVDPSTISSSRHAAKGLITYSHDDQGTAISNVEVNFSSGKIFFDAQSFNGPEVTMTGSERLASKMTVKFSQSNSETFDCATTLSNRFPSFL
jgi:hypothetical protein